MPSEVAFCMGKYHFIRAALLHSPYWGRNVNKEIKMENQASGL